MEEWRGGKKQRPGMLEEKNDILARSKSLQQTFNLRHQILTYGLDSPHLPL